MKKFIFISFLLIIGLLLNACSSSNLSDNTNTLNDGTGNFALFLADKPVNNVEKVLVTISEVQVKKIDTQWETINDFTNTGGEFEFDLMQLRFNETLLGQQMLATGQYEKIRLIIAADEQSGSKGKNSGKSKVVYQNGSEDDIFIPSGTKTGLKIDHNFTIQDGIVTRLVLDADVSEIMHTTGNTENNGDIVLRSTAIDVIDKVISGNIEGKVLADTGNSIKPYVDSDVVVQAIQNNEVIKSTVALATDHTETVIGESGEEVTVTKPAGTFFLRGLIEGRYDIKAYVANADGSENNNTSYQAARMESVEVFAEQTTEVGDLYLKNTGSIEGNIAADTDNNKTYEAITEFNVIVEAIQNDQVVSTVTAPANDSSTANHFKISGLIEGSYRLNIYLTDSTGALNETYLQTTEANIIITAGENNPLQDNIILEKVN